MKIEISDIWRIIYQRYILISIITFAALLTTAVVSIYVITPKYEARTTIMLKAESSAEGMAYDDLITSEKLLKTYSEFVKSNRVADEVMKVLNLEYKSTKLLEQLKVQGSNESLITTIIVKDEDPRKAVAISNTFASISIEDWQSVMKMDNVYILDEAEIGEEPEPVEPKPLLNIVLSFFLALILSIVIAILIEFLDKSLKTENQIEQVLQLPVLAVIPLAEQKGKKDYQPVEPEGGMKIHEE